MKKHTGALTVELLYRREVKRRLKSECLHEEKQSRGRSHRRHHLRCFRASKQHEIAESLNGARILAKGYFALYSLYIREHLDFRDITRLSRLAWGCAQEVMPHLHKGNDLADSGDE